MPELQLTVGEDRRASGSPRGGLDHLDPDRARHSERGFAVGAYRERGCGRREVVGATDGEPGADRDAQFVGSRGHVGDGVDRRAQRERRLRGHLVGTCRLVGPTPRCRHRVRARCDGETLREHQRDLDVGRPFPHGDLGDVVERRLRRLGNVLEQGTVEFDRFPGNVLGRHEREQHVEQRESVEQIDSVDLDTEEVEQLTDVRIGLEQAVRAVRISGSDDVGRQAAGDGVAQRQRVRLVGAARIGGGRAIDDRPEVDTVDAAQADAAQPDAAQAGVLEEDAAQPDAAQADAAQARAGQGVERNPEDSFLGDVAACELGFPQFGIGDLGDEIGITEFGAEQGCAPGCRVVAAGRGLALEQGERDRPQAHAGEQDRTEADRAQPRVGEIDALEREVVRQLVDDLFERDRLEWNAGELGAREQTLPSSVLEQRNLRERNRTETDRAQADGTQTDGPQSDRPQTDGTQPDRPQPVGLQLDRTQTGILDIDRAQTDVLQRDAAQSDAAQSDAAQACGVDGAIGIGGCPRGEFEGDLARRNRDDPDLDDSGFERGIGTRVDVEAEFDTERRALVRTELATFTRWSHGAPLVGVDPRVARAVRRRDGPERGASIEDRGGGRGATVVGQLADTRWSDDDGADRVAAAVVADQVEVEQIRSSRTVAGGGAAVANVGADDRVADAECPAVAIDTGTRTRRREVAHDRGVHDVGGAGARHGTTLAGAVADERGIQHRGGTAVAETAALAVGRVVVDGAVNDGEITAVVDAAALTSGVAVHRRSDQGERGGSADADTAAVSVRQAAAGDRDAVDRHVRRGDLDHPIAVADETDGGRAGFHRSKFGAVDADRERFIDQVLARGNSDDSAGRDRAPQ